MPCQTCGEESECKADCAEAAYNRWVQERVDRLGEELAMLPDFMACYECGHEHLIVETDEWGMKFVWRRPVGLGPVIDERRDPTQTYKVECGHLAM
jgi:hypothetical protein